MVTMGYYRDLTTITFIYNMHAMQGKKADKLSKFSIYLISSKLISTGEMFVAGYIKEGGKGAT